MRNFLRIAAVVCTVVFLFVAMSPTSRAQVDIVGRIQGTVTDTTGAVVPGASVTIKDEATGIARPALTTDKDGFFASDDLPVGSYTVTVEAKNFKTTDVTGNYVTAGGRIPVNVQLELGAVTEVVNVTGAAAPTNTISGEISTSILPRDVEALPLNQRHYEALVTLIPGAALQSSGLSPAAFTSGYNNSAAVFNGQRLDGQNWSVDGGFNLDSGSNNSVFNEVGVDFIQEVDVQSSNYDAEFGRSDSSTINVVTKSGGDQFHGGGFEFVQNNDWNAATSGTKLTGPTGCPTGNTSFNDSFCGVLPFHLNDFGWDVGGPIPKLQPKGKLFFFAGMEWKRFRGSATGLQNSSASETFPTLAEVQGNFSAGATSINCQFKSPSACSGVGLTTPAAVPTGCTITASVMSANCITTDGAAIAKEYEAASFLSSNATSALITSRCGTTIVPSATCNALPTTDGGGNMIFNLANPANIREDIGRVDSHPNDTNSMYFRYLHDYVDINNPYSTFGANPEVPLLPDARFRPGYNLQYSWTHIISPTLINEFKVNADWHSQQTPPGTVSIPGLTGSPSAESTYGLTFQAPLGQPSRFANSIPQITFNGNTGAVTPLSTATPTQVSSLAANFLESPTADINPMDNVTWVHGNHTTKFGVEYARNRKTQNSRNAYVGQLNFSNNAGASAATSPTCTAAGVPAGCHFGSAGSNSTGDPFADILLGNYQAVTDNSDIALGNFRFNDFEAFAENTWKVNKRLSIVAGIRWIYVTPTYALGNNMTNFNPFAFNTTNDAAFKTVGSSSTISLTSPGLLCGPLLTSPGTPNLCEYANGQQTPGGVPANQAGRVPALRADPSLVSQFQATAARGFYQPEDLYAPRLGFSFAPFDDKTVIRGGFGIFYDHPEGNALCGGINCQGYVPWVQSVSTTGVNCGLNGTSSAGTCGSDFDAAPAGGTPPAPSTLGQNGIDPRLVVARSYQYSLAVQRELPQSMLVQAAYVGNLGRHILRGEGINQPTWTAQEFEPVAPNPNTYLCSTTSPSGGVGKAVTNLNAYGCAGSATNYATTAVQGDQIRPYLGYTNFGEALSDVDSNYNSLQLSLTKRAGFVTAQASYTYSKAMGDDGGVGSAYNENPESECPFTCLVSTVGSPVALTGTVGSTATQSGGVVESFKRFDYAKLSYDATNIVAASFTVESPWGKNATGLLAIAEKGWSLSGVMHFQSGAPLTATATSNVGSSGVGVGRFANFTPGSSVNFSGTCDNPKAVCWLNQTAWSVEGSLGAGDTPLNNIIGPAFYQWDLSARKTFILPWREGMSVEIQGDAFNAFNQTNWNNPGTTAGSTGTVGTTSVSSFGWITGSLPARIVQIGGKFNF